MADPLPISALQHLLYCPRQCALIHLEQAWSENWFTAEGRVMHERTHEAGSESRPGVRIARALWVNSERLGLVGQCDVVEFGKEGDIRPVEYKRGKAKGHRADEVQLCAQGLCLEEMFGHEVSEGQLFYGKARRRHPVAFDAGLRRITEDAARRLHELIVSRELPAAVYERKKCGACSLFDICQPRATRSAEVWFTRSLDHQTASSGEEIEPFIPPQT